MNKTRQNKKNIMDKRNEKSLWCVCEGDREHESRKEKGEGRE